MLGCLVTIISVSPLSLPQLSARTWRSILQCFFSGVLACCYGFWRAGRDRSESETAYLQRTGTGLFYVVYYIFRLPSGKFPKG